jgi:hypothetical protein
VSARAVWKPEQNPERSSAPSGMIVLRVRIARQGDRNLADVSNERTAIAGHRAATHAASGISAYLVHRTLPPSVDRGLPIDRRDLTTARTALAALRGVAVDLAPAGVLDSVRLGEKVRNVVPDLHLVGATRDEEPHLTVSDPAVENVRTVETLADVPDTLSSSLGPFSSVN